MKIPKAIEILTDIAFIRRPVKLDEHREAIELGIEALTRLQWFRDQLERMSETQLPGETEEGE